MVSHNFLWALIGRRKARPIKWDEKLLQSPRMKPCPYGLGAYFYQKYLLLFTSYPAYQLSPGSSPPPLHISSTQAPLVFWLKISAPEIRQFSTKKRQFSTNASVRHKKRQLNTNASVQRKNISSTEPSAQQKCVSSTKNSSMLWVELTVICVELRVFYALN